MAGLRSLREWPGTPWYKAPSHACLVFGRGGPEPPRRSRGEPSSHNLARPPSCLLPHTCTWPSCVPADFVNEDGTLTPEGVCVVTGEPVGAGGGGGEPRDSTAQHTCRTAAGGLAPAGWGSAGCRDARACSPGAVAGIGGASEPGPLSWAGGVPGGRIWGGHLCRSNQGWLGHPCIYVATLAPLNSCPAARTRQPRASHCAPSPSIRRRRRRCRYCSCGRPPCAQPP